MHVWCSTAHTHKTVSRRQQFFRHSCCSSKQYPALAQHSTFASCVNSISEALFVVFVASPPADDGGSEPPLKRARSSSGGLETNTNTTSYLAAADSVDRNTPLPLGGGDNGREATPGDHHQHRHHHRSGGSSSSALQDDREARDAALNAELARFMIRTEPIGTDRHHQRYWYMQVGCVPVRMCVCREMHAVCMQRVCCV